MCVRIHWPNAEGYPLDTGFLFGLLPQAVFSFCDKDTAQTRMDDNKVTICLLILCVHFAVAKAQLFRNRSLRVG